MSGSKGQEIVYTWARLNTPTHKELSDTIDAALRRAKAEGIKESARVCRERAGQLSAEAVLILEQGDLSGPSDEFQWAASELRGAAKALDARAAKIEEGRE